MVASALVTLGGLLRGRRRSRADAATRVYNKRMIFPKPGVDLSNPANFASIGMTVTRMPAMAAIAGVVAAPPGLMTSADLPLREYAGRFKP
jgi:4-hydroxy-tetrahydrodipicolinate reductase